MLMCFERRACIMYKIFRWVTFFRSKSQRMSRHILWEMHITFFRLPKRFSQAMQEDFGLWCSGQHSGPLAERSTTISHFHIWILHRPVPLSVNWFSNSPRHWSNRARSVYKNSLKTAFDKTWKDLSDPRGECHWAPDRHLRSPDSTGHLTTNGMSGGATLPHSESSRLIGRQN